MGMMIKVHLAPFGEGAVKETSIDLHCGPGRQVLRWLGFAACSRLAYLRGETLGRYVPQSVLTADNQVLDVDIVLNEMFEDGAELFVEYSDGPASYRARWEGRPRTPPFQWGESGEVVPPHDTWLTQLDLRAHGVDRLVEPELLKHDPGFLAHDLADTRDILIKYGGALQAVFTVWQFSGADMAVEAVARMNLTQFRSLMVAAKVTTAAFTTDKVDDIFTAMAQSLLKGSSTKMDAVGGASINLLGFFLGLVHIAHHRAAAGSGAGVNTAALTPLSVKLEALVNGHLALHIFSDISRKVEKIVAAYTPGSRLLLAKGRKLTERTLDSCQLRRVRSEEVRVELLHVCRHLVRWKLLLKEFTFADLATMVVFAKHASADVERYGLHRAPLDLNYDEFERLLLAVSYCLYMLRKRKDPIEEFLGETMDYIFSRAGVLQEAAKEEED